MSHFLWHAKDFETNSRRETLNALAWLSFVSLGRENS